MGFSLVGNSGDSDSTVYDTSNTASSNPQSDLQDSGAGAFSVILSPQVTGGGTVSNLLGDSGIQDYYAPVTISSIGTAAGDAALQAAQNIADSQTSSALGNPSASTTPSWLSSLLSGTALYWILGGIVLLFLFHRK